MPYNSRYRVYKPAPAPSERRGRPRLKVNLFINKKTILLVVALFLVATGFHLVSSKKAAATEAMESAKAEQTIENKKLFAARADALLADNPQLTFSIAVAGGDGQVQTIGNSRPMNAASTTKLLTAAAFLLEAEAGKYNLNGPVDGANPRYLLRQLINKSDDGAWQQLNDLLTRKGLSDYANSLGLNSYNVETNQISAADMASLLQQLYSGKLLNKTHTAQLLSYMHGTNYEDFITPAVPLGSKIYHKVGLDGDNVNDAAIITSGQKSMVLVIFSNGNGTYDWDQRAALMQKITRSAVSAFL